MGNANRGSTTKCVSAAMATNAIAILAVLVVFCSQPTDAQWQGQAAYPYNPYAQQQMAYDNIASPTTTMKRYTLHPVTFFLCILAAGCILLGIVVTLIVWFSTGRLCVAGGWCGCCD